MSTNKSSKGVGGNNMHMFWGKFSLSTQLWHSFQWILLPYLHILAPYHFFKLYFGLGYTGNLVPTVHSFQVWYICGDFIIL